jgi:hypothetical protein
MALFVLTGKLTEIDRIDGVFLKINGKQHCLWRAESYRTAQLAWQNLAQDS